MKPTAPLRFGGKVALVSTSLKGSPTEYPKAILRLERKGIDLIPVDPEGQSIGPFSASDQARARAFSEAIGNPGFDAVLSIRGGYGAIRLMEFLEHLQWPQQHFPIWSGFSDATNIHAFLWKRLNAVTFHGPHLRGLGESEESFEDFWEVLSGKRGAGSPLSLWDTEVIQPGLATGLLLGGNLETLAHLAGTPWFPCFEGAILMIEDVDEPMYAIDRAIWQLHHAGAFRKISGVILGPFSSRPVRNDDPSDTVEKLVQAVLPSRVPMLKTTAPGHDLPMSTWPLNVNVRLDIPRFGSPSLTLKEDLFQPS